MQVLSWKL